MPECVLGVFRWIDGWAKRFAPFVAIALNGVTRKIAVLAHNLGKLRYVFGNLHEMSALTPRPSETWSSSLS